MDKFDKEILHQKAINVRGYCKIPTRPMIHALQPRARSHTAHLEDITVCGATYYDW